MDRRLWLTTLLFLGLSGVLSLLLSAPVRALVLKPLLYLGWLLAQQPQATVWLGATTLGLLVALWYWRRALPRKVSAAPPTKEPLPPPPLQELTQLIQRAKVSPVSQGRLAQRLAQLAISLRVQAEAISPHRAREDLRSGRWPPQPQLRAILIPAKRLRGNQYLENLSQALAALERYLGGGG